MLPLKLSHQFFLHLFDIMDLQLIVFLTLLQYAVSTLAFNSLILQPCISELSELPLILCNGSLQLQNSLAVLVLY